MVKIQQEFDSNHKNRFDWDQKIDENNIQMLGYLSLALAGEAGEVANCVKKIMRGDVSYSEYKQEVIEEVVDVFIYVMKLSYQMDFDLGKKYLEKLEVNRERFKQYGDE